MTQKKPAPAESKPGSCMCLEGMVQNLPVVFYRIRYKPTKVVEYISDSVLALTGYSPQDHYDDPGLSTKLIFRDDAVVILDHVNERSLEPLIIRMTCRDGRLIWAQVFLFYQLDKKGELESLSGIGVDVTEHMKQEQLMRQGLSVLSAATELEKMGGWEWDIKRQTMYWTKGVYDIHEFAEPYSISMNAELIERSIAAYHPDYREIVRDAFQTCVKDGTPYDLEVPFITGGGRQIWVRTIAKAIYENGEIIKVVGNFSDITDRKLQEIAMTRSSNRLYSLFEGMSEGFALHEMIYNEAGKAVDYRFLLVNPAFERITGLRAVDLVGQTVLEVMPHTEHTWIERYSEVVKTGKKAVFEDYSRELGKYYHVVAYSNTPSYFTVFVLDVSEMVSAREQLIAANKAAEESNRIKSAFLASMNHELRTPLNHIIGYSNLLCDAEDKMEVQSFADVIRASGEHLLQIFEDIFELTLAEHSMLQVNAREVDCFEHYIQNKTNLEEILRASGKADDIKLIFSPDLSAYNRKIFLDTTKVNQVLSNLMRNAIKFTPKGSVEFGFEFTDHDKIRYYVIDTGIGIPPDKQDEIFEIFRQADEGNTRNYGGVGIGLATCRRITEVMGGILSFESIVNQGTTFSLEIPIVKPGQDLIAPDSYSHHLVNDLAGKVILLAEDDRVSAMVLQRLLERYGANTLMASDGLEAVTICKANPQIDIVLMDIIMPKMNGAAAAVEIKKLHPNLAIIAITAGYQTGAKTLPEDDIFDSIITKPINQDILYREIRRFLGSIPK